jgi:small redox-active disulfide protein 2
MEIKVLGSGCAKCVKLANLVNETLKETGKSASVIKVTDIKSIMEYGVMITPALVIDEVVKVAGRIPAKDEIKNWL